MAQCSKTMYSYTGVEGRSVVLCATVSQAVREMLVHMYTCVITAAPYRVMCLVEARLWTLPASTLANQTYLTLPTH